MFKSYIKEYSDRIIQNDLLVNLPIHAMLPRMPECGSKYGQKKRIMFIGQDPDYLCKDFDGYLKNDIYKHILDYNKCSTAFDFNEIDDNFICWYKTYRYKFWEFSIDFISKYYDLNIIPSKFSQSLIDNDSNVREIYSTFGWGNFSALLFPHILERKYSKTKDLFEKANMVDYYKNFNIAQSIFSNIDFFENTCNPDIIIILTKLFNPNIFFNGKNIDKSYFDSKNNISKYDYFGNKQIRIISTYHPSYMSRKGNIDGFGIEDYVNEILTILNK
jgi:hypothetical protein